MAKTHGLPQQSFTAITFPNIQVWTRDADRWLPQKSIQAISNATGLGESHLSAMTLSGAYSAQLGLIAAWNQVPWLLKIGVYHRSRRSFGQQFCPVCVAEHGQYFLAWRLAFQTICPTHDVNLLDACPHCDSPVSIFYRSVQKPGLCHRCAKSSTYVKKNRPLVPSLEIKKLLGDLSLRLMHPKNNVDTPDAHSIRTLIGALLRKDQGKKLLNYWISQTGLPPRQMTSAWFENLRVEERRAVLAAIEMALRRGPTTMIVDMHRFNLSRQTLWECSNQASPWLSRVLFPYLKDNPRRKAPAHYAAEQRDPLLSLKRKTKRATPCLRAQARARMIEQFVNNEDLGKSPPHRND